MQQENRMGEGTVWGLGLREGQGLSVEEDPTLGISLCMQAGQQ